MWSNNLRLICKDGCGFDISAAVLFWPYAWLIWSPGKNQKGALGGSSLKGTGIKCSS